MKRSRRGRFPLGRKSVMIAVVCCLGGGWALLPRFTLACNYVTDPGCGIDVAQYNFFLGIAKVLWQLDRILLNTAYQLTAVRAWVVDIAFSGAYDQMVAIIDPAIVPVATLAMMLACLAILVAPLFGVQSPFNIRQILMIALFGSATLTLLGPSLADLDAMRMNLGLQIYTIAADSNVGQLTLSGSSEGDMTRPTRIYPHVGCGVVLDRHTDDGNFDGYDDGSFITRIDEQVAAFVDADGTDIHCPGARTNALSTDLPAAFYDAQGANYAAPGGIENEDATSRAARIAAIQNGVTRLFIAILPALLAVIYFVIQLVLTLCLIALYVAFPVGMLFGMFRKDMGWLGGYFRNGALVIQASWTTSFILGLVVAALIAAANSGNAAVFAGGSICSFFFSVYLLTQSVQTFRGSLGALASVASAVTGGGSGAISAGVNALRGAGSFATGTLSGTGAAVAGVGAAGFIGATALARSGSGRYALGAALGRSVALTKVGQVAASMGLVSNEVADGMYAGSLSTRSLRNATGTMQRDGKTYREAADQRKATSVVRDATQRVSGSLQLPGAASYTGQQSGARLASAPPPRPIKQGDTVAYRWEPKQRKAVATNLGRALPPSYAQREQLSRDEAATCLRSGGYMVANKDGTYTTWNARDGAKARSATIRRLGSLGAKPATGLSAARAQGYASKQRRNLIPTRRRVSPLTPIAIPAPSPTKRTVPGSMSRITPTLAAPPSRRSGSPVRTHMPSLTPVVPPDPVPDPQPQLMPGPRLKKLPRRGFVGTPTIEPVTIPPPAPASTPAHRAGASDADDLSFLDT
jgi:hypothetical protein